MPTTLERPELGSVVQISRYPQLKRLCWALGGVKSITREAAHQFYQNLGDYLDPSLTTTSERALMASLKAQYGQFPGQPAQQTPATQEQAVENAAAEQDDEPDYQVGRRERMRG